jgi:hypothetical protein
LIILLSVFGAALSEHASPILFSGTLNNNSRTAIDQATAEMVGVSPAITMRTDAIGALNYSIKFFLTRKRILT